MSRKRKTAPQLYDHNAKSNNARTFRKAGNSNSYIIHSSNVTTHNAHDHGEPDGPSTFQDTVHDYHPGDTSFHDDGPVPPNPDSAESVGIKVKPSKRYQNTDAPLTTWVKDFRTASLDERMRYEGRGGQRGRVSCPDCTSPGTVRCEDCYGRELVCRSCIVQRHHRLPFHRVKEWNGSYFQATTLRDLGVRIQLGDRHAPGTACLLKHEVHKAFVVLHTNGIHTVYVDSCNCTPPDERPVSVAQQLMRAGLYPATHLEPQTCATFELMQSFHLLSLEGKISHYQYYKTLHYRTDNTGTKKIPGRYAAFCLMARKWRHECMLKRAGRAYVQSESRVEMTAPGELAVPCRACPIPGVNLPEGWKDAPPESAFLYWQVVCIDACFRFKNRMRSNGAKDPTLGPGWSYMVDHEPYLEHVRKYASETEISTCAGFAAVHLANLKGIKGHRTSGVAGVCCARQDCFKPTGVGDLQVGERRANVDYIFLSALFGIVLLTVIASYDIACQYLKGFWQRVLLLPEHLQPKVAPENLHGKIPKFHYDAHQKKDHAQFSFNFTRGVGRINGEGIERLWGYVRKGVGQTVEMGPGARHDVLDDFFGYSNYRKMVDIGNFLLKLMVAAIPQAISHRRAFEEFDKHLRRDMSEQVEEWDRAYAEWDKKPGPSPCLFDTKERGLSTAQIKLQLANEEAAKEGLQKGAPHTPSLFILLALEVEDIQRRLLSDIKEHPKPTTLQQAGFQTRRVTTRKRILQLRELQSIYMPGLRIVLPDPTVLDDAPDVRAENVRLYFPSDIESRADRDRACVNGLADVEARVRQALASDNLHDLRRHLLTRTYLNKWRVKNVSGQRTSTRARTLRHTIDMRVLDAKTRYRRSRKALLVLLGKGSWEAVLQELHDDDVRGLNERLLTDREKADREARIARGTQTDHDALGGIHLTGTIGEGQRTLSWIWVSCNKDDNSPEMVEALRVEWAKCKARASRWHEELRWLDEEMRRVLEFGVWKEGWWRDRVSMRVEGDVELMEGLSAYALEHAADERTFREMLEGKWIGIRHRVQGVLRDLAASTFTETPADTPVVVDIEEDVDDPNGGAAAWASNGNDEEEEGERIA